MMGMLPARGGIPCLVSHAARHVAAYFCSMKMTIDKSTRAQMRERCRFCQVVFCICFAVAVALIVGGFFVPPMGVIDGSVLTAVGELIVFPALAFGMRAVELGYDLRLTRGDASMTVSSAPERGKKGEENSHHELNDINNHES